MLSMVTVGEAYGQRLNFLHSRSIIPQIERVDIPLKDCLNRVNS